MLNELEKKLKKVNAQLEEAISDRNEIVKNLLDLTHTMKANLSASSAQPPFEDEGEFILNGCINDHSGLLGHYFFPNRIPSERWEPVFKTQS